MIEREPVHLYCENSAYNLHSRQENIQLSAVAHIYKGIFESALGQHDRRLRAHTMVLLRAMENGNAEQKAIQMAQHVRSFSTNSHS